LARQPSPGATRVKIAAERKRWFEAIIEEMDRTTKRLLRRAIAKLKDSGIADGKGINTVMLVVSGAGDSHLLVAENSGPADGVSVGMLDDIAKYLLCQLDGEHTREEIMDSHVKTRGCSS
jgi:hypothetical protein